MVACGRSSEATVVRTRRDGKYQFQDILFHLIWIILITSLSRYMCVCVCVFALQKHVRWVHVCACVERKRDGDWGGIYEETRLKCGDLRICAAS